MKSLLLSVTFIFFIVLGCPATVPTTDNPINPKADDPLVLGEEVMPPLGCLGWQVREGEENADC